MQTMKQNYTRRVMAGLLTGMLAGTLFLSACSTASERKVASVNGTPITKSEYDKTYEELKKAFYVGNSVPKEQEKQFAETIKRMALNKLILETLIHNEAAKMGLRVTEQDIKKYKDEKIYKDPNMEQQFKAFLAQNKMSESDFDEMLKDNLLLTKLMESKAGPEIAVTDSEVKTAYDRNKEQFKLPERIHASHILIQAIEPQMKQDIRSKEPQIKDAELAKRVADEKKARQEKAKNLFKEVKENPGRFEALAKLDSDDKGSAAQGGDLGPMVKNSTDPSFWAAIDKTPPGQLYNGVVTSQFGYHIVKVLERLKPQTQTFETAKEGIREQLSQMKRQAFMQKWAEQQRNAAKISIEPAYQPKEIPMGGATTSPVSNAAPAPSTTTATPAPVAPAVKH